MAWISIHQQIRDHRKTRNLFRTLNVSRAEAIGTLALIWSWAIDNCNQEGELLSVTKEDIADAAYWRGDSDVLYNALVDAGWIDEINGRMYLHDWIDFNKPFYDYIARKEKDKQRKRNSLSAEIPVETPRKICGNSAEIPEPFRVSHSPAHSPSPSPSHLVINNNNNNAREEVVAGQDGPATGTQAINWAEKNWGRMIPKGEAESILAWCDDFKARGSVDPDAVIIEALRCCLDADARNMNYLKAVLTDWNENGVLTVENVQSRETERKSQKEHKRGKAPGDRPPKATKGKYEDFYL